MRRELVRRSKVDDRHLRYLKDATILHLLARNLHIVRIRAFNPLVLSVNLPFSHFHFTSFDVSLRQKKGGWFLAY